MDQPRPTHTGRGETWKWPWTFVWSWFFTDSTMGFITIFHHHLGNIRNIFVHFFQAPNLRKNLSQESNLWQDIPSSVPWYGKISASLWSNLTVWQVSLPQAYTHVEAWLWNSHHERTVVSTHEMVENFGLLENHLPMADSGKWWLGNDPFLPGRLISRCYVSFKGGWKRGRLANFVADLFPDSIQSFWRLETSTVQQKMVLSDGWHLFYSQFSFQRSPRRKCLGEKHGVFPGTGAYPEFPTTNDNARGRTLCRIAVLAIFKRAL